MGGAWSPRAVQRHRLVRPTASHGRLSMVKQLVREPICLVRSPFVLAARLEVSSGHFDWLHSIFINDSETAFSASQPVMTVTEEATRCPKMQRARVNVVCRLWTSVEGHRLYVMTEMAGVCNLSILYHDIGTFTNIIVKYESFLFVSGANRLSYSVWNGFFTFSNLCQTSITCK